MLPLEAAALAQVSCQRSPAPASAGGVVVRAREMKLPFTTCMNDYSVSSHASGVYHMPGAHSSKSFVCANWFALGNGPVRE